jgi:phospholipid/cholesterol/gamma-HCH transport system permease protein
MMDYSERYEQKILSFFSWFGEISAFTGRYVRSALSKPLEGNELIRQMVEIGVKSLPLVLVSGAAIGAVLTLHTEDTLRRLGADSMIPTLLVFAMIQESGPLITALVVAARVGAGIGAELGSMRVTDQIDALEVSGVEPVRYLVATRVTSLIVMLPILTLFADAAGIFVGFLMSGFNLPRFIDLGFELIKLNDLLPNTFRTVVFGLIIGVVSCYQGLNCRGGTAGVGRAATRSVVISTFFLIIADVVTVKFVYLIFGGDIRQ